MGLYNIGFEVKSNLVTERGHRKITRDLNRIAGHVHRTEFFPKHFENRPETYPGAGGYRFKKRTAKWNRYKMRKVGHITANVLTGKLKKRVVNESRVTATSNKWTVYTSIGFQMPAWQRKEIEIVTPREIKEKIRWFGHHYVKMTGYPQYQKYRRQRAGRKR